jgi:uncharacterized protein (DUF488 family)
VTTFYSAGHGTRTTEELVTLLREPGIGLVADVRRFPGSRRHPHFSREALAQDLPARGIAYEWWGEDLGGRRRAPADASRHSAWRVPAFRAYAAHMDSAAFQTALVRLEEKGAVAPVALMCAESMWWRCHRRLIADALVARGHRLVHLISPGQRHEHRLDEKARIIEGRPVYDVGVTGTLEL